MKSTQDLINDLLKPDKLSSLGAKVSEYLVDRPQKDEGGYGDDLYLAPDFYLE